MSFSFSLFARQREGKERKERENTLPLPTLLRAFNQMDVASRACTLSLAKNARGAIVVRLMRIIRNSSKQIRQCLTKNFIYCLSLHKSDDT